MNISLPDFLLMCGSLFLIASLLSEIVDWMRLFLSLTENYQQPFFPQVLTDISVESIKPIASSTALVPSIQQNYKFPVNIKTREVVVMELCKPLEWIGYSTKPDSMTIANHQNKIILYGSWLQDSAPFIQGGSLIMKPCKLHSISFRWGASDNDGSEHSLDYVRYPLEMQVSHVQDDTDFSPKNITIENKTTQNTVVVSYLFQIKEYDNPQLSPIIRSLCQISEPESEFRLQPFQLDSLFPTFEQKFYTYFDSITHIVYPKPIDVSSTQVNEFRKLYQQNWRPTQELTHCPTVYFHE